jgi:hypothetical protein
MYQRLTAILQCNNLEQAQVFFERLGFRREESPDDYRMLSDGVGGYSGQCTDLAGSRAGQDQHGTVCICGEALLRRQC